MLSSRRLLASAIVAATVTFAVGVVVERNAAGERAQPSAEPVAAPHAGDGAEPERAEAGGHSEGGETGGERAQPDERSHGADSEKADEAVGGIDPESTPLVIVAVIASLVLAAAVVRWTRVAWLLWVVALAMAAFAALDVREVLHQLGERRTGLVLLAGVVAILHAAAAAISTLQARRTSAS